MPRPFRPVQLRELAVALLVVAVVASSADAAAPAHKLKLMLGATYVDVERATAGGTLLLVGFERGVRDYSRVFRRVEREGVASASGTARIDLGRPIETTSFWVAIDLQSTAFAAVAAPGSRLKEGEFLAANLKADASGKRAKAQARFEYVHALLIRPGGGAWQLTAGDGSQFDGDGEMNGVIELPARKFEKRHASEPTLDEYRESDLLIVFVPRQMGYLVMEVPK